MRRIGKSGLLVLGTGAVCGFAAGVLWIVAYLLELSFGLSTADLAAHRGSLAIGEGLFVVVAAAVVGSGLGLVAHIERNRGPAEGAGYDPAPSVDIAPAWWACAILVSLAVAIASFSWRGLQALWTKPDSIHLFDFGEVAVDVVIGIGIGLLYGAMRGGQDLLRRVQPMLHSWPALSVAAGIGKWWLASAWIFTIVSALSLAVMKALAVKGIEVPVTPALTICAALVAAVLSSIELAVTWSDRRRQLAPPPTEVPRTDFWAWDLAPETSHSGVAASGYPFHVWRESTDNRLGVSRSRFCCVVDDGRELQFMFFDPSQDRQPTWSAAVGSLLAIVYVMLVLTLAWSNSRSLSWLGLSGTIFTAALVGTLFGVLWHLGLIVKRWYFGRFAKDGRFSTKPLRLLSGFDTVDAAQVRSESDGDAIRGGYGLTAVFDDGTMLVLTRNAWDYPSIVAKHQALTQAFREPRDEFIAKCELARLKSGDQPVTSAPAATGSSATGSRGVPDAL